MKIEIEKTESSSGLTRQKTGTEEYELELSHAMLPFGSKVSVIERAAPLLSRGDPDVSEGLQKLLKKEGLSLALNTRIKAVSGTSGHAVKVIAEQNGN